MSKAVLVREASNNNEAIPEGNGGWVGVSLFQAFPDKQALRCTNLRSD